jgi:hypothetical protein
MPPSFFKNELRIGKIAADALARPLGFRSIEDDEEKQKWADGRIAYRRRDRRQHCAWISGTSMTATSTCNGAGRWPQACFRSQANHYLASIQQEKIEGYDV